MNAEMEGTKVNRNSEIDDNEIEKETRREDGDEEVKSVVELLIELNERVEKIVKENTVAIRSREKVLGQLVKESSERVSELEELKQKSESELKRLCDALDVFKKALPKF